MYLNKVKKDNRIHLSIAESYRDKEAKTSRKRIIQSLGYLDILDKEFDDPIAHFKALIHQMNEEKKKYTAPIVLEFNTASKLSDQTNKIKNFGYAAFSHLYHTLEIDMFLIGRQKSTNIKTNTNNIMKFLVYSRLLTPSSKKKTFENREQFFERTNYSLDDVYRALAFFNDKSYVLSM